MKTKEISIGIKNLVIKFCNKGKSKVTQNRKKNLIVQYIVNNKIKTPER